MAKKTSTTTESRPEVIEDTVYIGGYEIKFTMDVSPRGINRYRTALKLLMDSMIREKEKQQRNS